MGWQLETEHPLSLPGRYKGNFKVIALGKDIFHKEVRGEFGYILGDFWQSDLKAKFDYNSHDAKLTLRSTRIFMQAGQSVSIKVKEEGIVYGSLGENNEFFKM